MNFKFIKNARENIYISKLGNNVIKVDNLSSFDEDNNSRQLHIFF